MQLLGRAHEMELLLNLLHGSASRGEGGQCCLLTGGAGAGPGRGAYGPTRPLSSVLPVDPTAGSTGREGTCELFGGAGLSELLYL